MTHGIRIWVIMTSACRTHGKPCVKIHANGESCINGRCVHRRREEQKRKREGKRKGRERKEREEKKREREGEETERERKGNRRVLSQLVGVLTVGTHWTKK